MSSIFSKPHNRLTVYALSAGFVLLILALQLSLSIAGKANVSAFLSFLTAVMISAWLGGTGPGLFATFLSILAGDYFFMEPYWSFGLGHPNEQIELFLFIVQGVVIAILAGQLHRARDAAVAGQTEARALERRILEISDAEQRRIGHDLHDGLGQHLTGIALVAKRIEQRLIIEKSGQVEEASKVCALAKTAVQWTHDLSRSLSPPALEREGLAEALRQLAAEAENIFNIRCSLRDDGHSNLRDVSVGVHLYRIAQEAISNAVKHGNARNIEVELSSSNEGTTVRIADDGTGFNQPHNGTDGLGLQIMRYRAHMIGATIDVEHPGGGGTAITCYYRPIKTSYTGSGHGDN